MAFRFKYYHAWLLADAICNNSGLGFNGYDKENNAKWDLLTNINVLSFEVFFFRNNLLLFLKIYEMCICGLEFLKSVFNRECSS